MVFLVMWFGFLVICQGKGWAYSSSTHSTLGLITLIMGSVLVIGGVVANYLRQYANMDWYTSKVTFSRRVHKYFGWFVILFA